MKEICNICREEDDSTKYYEDWDNYVCSDCNKLMIQGWNDCYPDNKITEQPEAK